MFVIFCTFVRSRSWDGLKGTLGSATKYVEIMATIRTEYHVSGLAPLGDQLVVLAYLPDKDDTEADSVASAFPRQVCELLHFFTVV